jgi:filamentous hemagglutinin family protein
VNHTYRLIWSCLCNSWIAVAETTRARGKGSARKLVVAAQSVSASPVPGWTAILLALAEAAFFAPSAKAAPVGGQVVSGSGAIAQSGTTTTITQTSPNLSLIWRGFNVAPNETVNFLQPSATAIAVNRIFDANGTQILGHLNANGQVYLINPNGVLFGSGAQVNVGGLVASTLDLNDTSLNGSSRTFSGSGTGSVINQGTIAAASGGYVALLGNHVANQGTITAQLGTVALGAGSVVTLKFSGSSLVGVQVDQSTLNNLAENGGLVVADGGTVIMSAGAADALLASVVNNTGVIEARTVENHNGTITLLGGMTAGQVNVGGTLDASAPNGGNGGAIETSAAQVHVAGNANITTAARLGLAGTWLIDPQDFTVSASGGDITGSTLSSELANNNITLESSQGGSSGSGNVNINDTVSWSANTTLTLTASNNVNVNANVTAIGATAGLVINPNTANGVETASGGGALNVAANTAITLSGNHANLSIANSSINLSTGAVINLPGSNPSLSIAGQTYAVINSLGTAGSTTGTDLQGINGNLSGDYALGGNIDASATSSWNSGAGFLPIGTSSTPFNGIFNGLGHTISNLSINRPSTNYVGLFGYGGASSVFENVGLVGGSVSGFAGSYSGGGGGPNPHYGAGALVGVSFGQVSNAYSTASVSGNAWVGGLVGISQGSINNSHATGTVTGGGWITGGLAGANYGAISNSYSTGNVTGTTLYTGGLVGAQQFSASISNSYATGQVSGAGPVGGLLGFNFNGASVGNSYATGRVSGTSSKIGGLVGSNYGSATIANSYATGNVSGTSEVGGLVGWNTYGNTGNPNHLGASAISNSYATGQVNGTSQAGGLVGLNQGSSVSNSYAVGQVSGSSQLGGLVGVNSSGGTVTASFWNTVTTGQATSAGGGLGLTSAQMQSQANFTSATAANGNVNPGWDFSGTWVMYDGETNPLLRAFMTPLTVTANNAAVSYNGLDYSGSGGVSYSATPTGNLFGTLSYSGQNSVNVGTYAITPGGLYSNQQGYIISYAGGMLTVNPATLIVTANNASKTYGQANPALSVSYSGFVDGQTAANLTTPASASTMASASSGVGSYAIVASGAVDPNYHFIYQSGTLTVNPATLASGGTSPSTTSTTMSNTLAVPAAVSSTTTWIAANIPVPQVGDPPRVTPSANLVSTETASTSSPKVDGELNPALDTEIFKTDLGSALTINVQHNGVRLPENLISFNP